MGLVSTKTLDGLAGTKDQQIVMVGLDSAGKSTFLDKLKLGELVTTIPTTNTGVGFNVETLEYKNIRFTVQDFSGQEKLRKLWRHAYLGTHGIIFVVDSTDRDRIQDAREELWTMLKEEAWREAVILVFANKQDLPHAMAADEVSEKLGLHDELDRLWFTQSTCATSGAGIYNGLNWLLSSLRSKQARLEVSSDAKCRSNFVACMRQHRGS